MLAIWKNSGGYLVDIALFKDAHRFAELMREWAPLIEEGDTIEFVNPAEYNKVDVK